MVMKILIEIFSLNVNVELVALVKEQCRLDMRKYSFFQRTIIKWNKLSTDCVLAV